MSLIVCNGCGKEIDESLDKCSNCGVSVPKKSDSSFINKKWSQLTEVEIKAIVKYRKETKQFWTFIRIFGLFLFFVFLVFVFLSFYNDSYFFDSIAILLAFIAILIGKLDEVFWFKKNVKILYQMGILK